MSSGATAKAALLPVGKKLVELGVAKFPLQLKKWQAPAKIAALSKQVRQVTLVKTLWSLDKPTSLYEFYYPSRVTYPSGISKEGVSLASIGIAAESIGFRTLVTKVGLDKLAEDAPLPFIAHWKQNHFVVVFDIKKDIGNKT